jgi:hypothetical protein
LLLRFCEPSLDIRHVLLPACAVAALVLGQSGCFRGVEGLALQRMSAVSTHAFSRELLVSASGQTRNRWANNHKLSRHLPPSYFCAKARRLAELDRVST